MAASSRCVARSMGRCTLSPTRCKRRLLCDGSELTPKVRQITSPTRLHVHTWPRKPEASAPRSKSAGSCASGYGGSLGVGPAAGWRRRPSSTPSARALKPLAHRPRRHPQRGGDVLLFPARCFALPGASPPSFAPVQPGFLAFHGRRLPPL